MELPSTATRRPRGSGAADARATASSMACMVGATMTPAASIASSSAARPRPPSPRWEAPTTATTGTRELTRPATRANLRGFPSDSRYRATARTSGRSLAYWSRSLPETSARWPAET